MFKKYFDLKIFLSIVLITLCIIIPSVSSSEVKTTEEAYVLGQELMSQGKYREAIQQFDWILQMDPSMARVWYFKGKCLEQLKSYDEALVCYNNAINRNPMLVEAWYGKGNMHYELGQYKDAVDSYDMAFSLDTHAHSVEIIRKRDFAITQISPTQATRQISTTVTTKKPTVTPIITTKKPTVQSTSSIKTAQKSYSNNIPSILGTNISPIGLMLSVVAFFIVLIIGESWDNRKNK